MFIIRKRALGDVLWAEPVIRAMSKQNKHVIVYTKFTDLFLHYPEKNVTFYQDLNFFQAALIRLEQLTKTHFFSINLELSYEKAPYQHILHAYQQKARLPLTREYPKLYLSNSEKERISTAQKYVVLHLSSASAKQNYRNIYGISWEKIAEYITQKGYKVIEIGDAPGVIPHLYSSYTLREMIALISKASFFIGLDSGPSHIAASFKIPSIIFFGAVNPQYRHFMEQFRGFVLQQPCKFAGCYHNKIPQKEHICPLVGSEGVPICCIFGNTEVLDTIDQLIEKYIG